MELPGVPGEPRTPHIAHPPAGRPTPRGSRISILPAARYRLEAHVRLHASVTDVFEFFSRAENLQELTPAWLHFELLDVPPATMRVGTTIDYRLRLHRFPIRWRSVISEWDPPRAFVDEQVRGPYRSWRHAHRFDADGDWTRVSDEVDFEVLGGRFIARAFVLPDLLRIFHFRQRVLLGRFGGEPGSVSVRPA